MKKSMKLKAKLAMIYIVAGLIPTLVIAAASIVQLRASLRKNGTENLNSYLYQASASVENSIEIYDNLFNYISYNEAIPQVLSYEYESDYDKYTQLVATVDPLVLTVLDYHDEIDSIKIYTDTDTQYSDYIYSLDDIENEEWYEEALSGGDTHWFVDLESQTAILASKMLMMGRYNINAILVMEVDYNALFDAFDKSILSNYGVFVVDSRGSLIYEKANFNKNYQNYSIDFENFEKNADNSRYKIINRESDITGWTVWIYKPNILLISSARPIVVIAVMAVVACLVAVILSTRFVGAFVIRRINNLQEGMKQVEKGDFTVNVQDDEDDEIGELILGFEKMLAKINALISEVYESKIKEKEYEMKALQAQINPHFLYNTLSLINWKAIAAGAEDISKITLALSTFYRTSLNKGKNVMSISDEIDNMKSYLSIQLMMHDDDFETVVDIDDEILKYSTLNLILQPLIENAIDHGIDVNTGVKGVITITGLLDGDDIVLAVEDNGVGMTEEQAMTILTKDSKGYGVRNVNERIKLFYGEQYSLKITSEIGKGTRVEARFPKKL